jgi:RND family efflux transporter MFP subunit
MILGCVALVSCGTSKAPDAKHPAPATVENPRPESALTTVTLSPEAEERLGIETAEVARRPLRSSHAYAGELMARPGRAVTVSAPVGGTLVSPSGGLPAPGARLRQGQAVLGLVPLAGPDQDPVRREAESRARHEAARLQADRARELLAEGAGSQKQYESAQAELEVATANLEAARRQLELLHQGGRAGAITVVAPFGGRLGALLASPGQTVPQAAPLFEFAAESPLWVRVPVYSGELASLDLGSEISVHRLGVPVDVVGLGRPVTGPPSANPAASTSDVYFELDNDEGRLRPGGKVGVSIPERTSGAKGSGNLAVPLSAVLYDLDGGAWVYEQSAPQTYRRRRIEISHTLEGWAALTRGPDAGTVVVVTGAPELFGAEFGVGH